MAGEHRHRRRSSSRRRDLGRRQFLQLAAAGLPGLAAFSNLACSSSAGSPENPIAPTAGSSPLVAGTTPVLAPRVNGGINVHPLRKLEAGTGPGDVTIVPELVALQLESVYELGFDGLRITAPFGDRGGFLAAIPYVRAARAIGIDAVVVLSEFAGLELPRALYDDHRREKALRLYASVFGPPPEPVRPDLGGLGPRGVGRIAFQILNEPAHFFGVPPDVYVRDFLTPCFVWLRASHPEIIVVSAAEVGNSAGPARLRAMLEAGLERSVDRIAYHIYDRSIIAELSSHVRSIVWVTESGSAGTASHLPWVRDVFPEIRARITDSLRIFYYDLYDPSPGVYRLIDIQREGSAYRKLVESADLHAYFSQNVLAAARGPILGFSSVIPEIRAYFPTAVDLAAYDEGHDFMTFPVLAVVLALGAPAQTPPSPAPTATPQPVESPWADDEVRYPLGRLSMPDLAEPGQPFRLVDLRYELRDQNGSDQSLGARLRVGRLGYLGLDFVGERRELTLETRRVRLAAAAEGDLHALATSVRAPWFILSTEATEYRASADHGWVLHPALGVRVTPDLELLTFAETDSARPNHRLLRAASLGVLWQRDSRLEVGGAYTRRYTGTVDGFEKTSDAGDLFLVAQLGRSLELSGDGLLQDIESRFAYRQYGGSLGARAVLAGRLLLEGGAESLFERHTGQRSHKYQGGLSWHARRPSLPRGGEAAQRSLALARRATAMGYNERRVSNDQERREQRMRLSLMAREEELRDEVEALYRAQVAEREVAVLGAEFVDTADSLPGVSSRIARLFVGVPWPPSWPWECNPDAVPFLRLDLERKRETTAVDFDAVTSRVSLSVALNREMDLVVRWSDAQPSALEVIQGLGKRRTFELSYVYALGR